MEKEKILEEAKAMTRHGGFGYIYNPSLEYESYRIRQIMNEVSSIMKNEFFPFTEVRYSVLVRREKFRAYMVNTVSTQPDMTPHELNSKRVEALNNADKRMEDVGIDGYEDYGIVHLKYVCETRKMSIDMMLNAVEDKNNVFAFLWFDYEQQNDVFPTIKW